MAPPGPGTCDCWTYATYLPSGEITGRDAMPLVVNCVIWRSWTEGATVADVAGWGRRVASR